MHTAVCPEGTAERFGGGPPDLSQVNVLAENFTSQAVTPMTDRTSRYYFSWGPRAGEGSAAMADSMLELAMKAFTEDKQMIEAQQRVIDTAPARKEVLTSADLGPMQMRAVIERLIEAERGHGAVSAA
jgi:vanillate O-demethylase monooxygenase subunit